MISHKYKCIFIHIPKCAGTSIEQALGHFDEYSGRGRQDHRTIRMIENPAPPIQVISSKENIIQYLKGKKRIFYDKTPNPKNKLSVTRQQYQSYFKFTFVRNPWARAYSWYKNVIRDESHLRAYGVPREITLRDFLAAYVGRHHLESQLFWLKGFDSSIPMDFIGKFEDLHADFEAVKNKLGIKNISLPHLIKGEKDDYRNAFDSQSIQLVQDCCQEEIVMFNYHFEK